ncbi:hypothetical protein CBM2605_A80103 [Cupriavidus neocaledonicus]|uniref:Transposase n=1 Tax=Cupriavidus neocaledonicus TaxID=1040979 RepID=A0ABY1V4Q3_9BURK|nr:hypothetical protein CBM2605_A80103 [Cupriavidus neocaledonicus]
MPSRPISYRKAVRESATQRGRTPRMDTAHRAAACIAFVPHLPLC